MSQMTLLAAISIWFLGLSVLVQVLQEIYKYLTSSKSRVFEHALADFAGPFVVGRLKQDARLTVRGPLQFRRVSIAGRLLPMNADDLATAIEKGAPEWQRLAARALDFEVALQKGRAARPSPNVTQMLAGLTQQLETAGGDAQSATFGDATRVARFLWDWRVLGDDGKATDAELNAARVRYAFRREFFPFFETIQRHYDQFLQNFGYQYRRRTLRQTFTIAFIVAVVMNLPFEQIFGRGTALNPRQALALDPWNMWAVLSDGRLLSLRYLFGCLTSALLITFGARLLNDVGSSLFRASRPHAEHAGPAAPDPPISTRVA